MALYWTLKSIPELRHLPLIDRFSIYAGAVRASRRRLPWWRGLTESLVLGGLPTVAVAFLGDLVGHPLLGTLAGGCLGGFVISQREIARVQRELQAHESGKPLN